MERCPACGWSPKPPPRFEPASPALPLDLTIHRVGSTSFEEPVRVTNYGLYVVGANEDGNPILTRLPLSAREAGQ